MNYIEKYGLTASVLAVSKFAGVEPRPFTVLLRTFGDLDGLLNAEREDLLAVNDMTEEMAERILSSVDFLDEAEAYIQALEARDIGVATRYDDIYPQQLFELNDPPTALYYRGRLPANGTRTITISGTDTASNEGIELTAAMAQACGKADVQVVSTLHQGIDAAAHLGCRASGGAPFAALDYGLDGISSEGAMPLAIDIVTAGGALSEFPPEQDVTDETAASVNRLIAGLSHAVLITEFYQDSERALDLIDCCSQIGKLLFVLIDPRHGALSDEESLHQAAESGAIMIVGLDKMDDIIKSLV